MVAVLYAGGEGSLTEEVAEEEEVDEVMNAVESELVLLLLLLFLLLPLVRVSLLLGNKGTLSLSSCCRFRG